MQRLVAVSTRPPDHSVPRPKLLFVRAEVAELADAPDSKSGGAHAPCGFDSHLRHLVIGGLRDLHSPYADLSELRARKSGWLQVLR